MEAVYSRFKELKNVPDYKRIISKKILFEDPQFKPKNTSLFSDSKSKFSQEKVDKWKSRVEWRRIKDIYDKDEITIVENISAGDVVQGEIGDGYFMSTLTSIAYQQPTEINKLFITKEFNESGIYAMNLLVYGGYHVVVVDDYIPYDIVSKHPVFADKKTKNIWPILLEKAWAKINGSYEGIVTGSAGDALKFLVPYPIERDSYDPEKQTEEGMWNKIEDAIEGRYMITCSSRDNKEITQEDYEKLGLSSNHCYSILGQYCFEHSGKQIKLLKIGNPWDRHEWKGDWSDSDSKWNFSLKFKVKFNAKLNGEFYISFNDFLTYLSSYVICKIDPFYDNHSVELSHK